MEAPIRPRRRELGALDWTVCMLLPPAGIAWAVWSLLSGNPLMARKRAYVALFSLCSIAALWVALGRTH
jgi:hypothetical protein